MLSDKLIALTRQLYPTGRAFKMPANGFLEGLHTALAISEGQAYQDAVAIHYSLLPDNSNFTAEDATDWERRLGLITNTAVSLADRKLAIKRKLTVPGVNPAKGNYLYIEGQLQAAGFDVFVHENIPVQDPVNFLNDGTFGQLGDYQLGNYQLGDASTVFSNLFQWVQLADGQLGDYQLGTLSYLNKVANHIKLDDDMYFSVGDNLRSVFFIGGEVLGTFADVDEERRDEFRQLILKLKPTQTVAYLFINYI